MLKAESGMEFNQRKFKELILYLAEKCSDDILWGATKLNKQLFFCDFLAYQQSGQSITGADYMALDKGPVPRRFLPIRAQMVADEDIIIEQRQYQTRIVPLRQPDLSQFTDNEHQLIDTVVLALKDSTADQVSDLSHRFIGWQAAIAEGSATNNHVTIPYGTVFVRRPTLTEQELQDALAMACKYEWPI